MLKLTTALVCAALVIVSDALPQAGHPGEEPHGPAGRLGEELEAKAALRRGYPLQQAHGGRPIVPTSAHARMYLSTTKTMSVKTCSHEGVC